MVLFFGRDSLAAAATVIALLEGLGGGGAPCAIALGMGFLLLLLLSVLFFISFAFVLVPRIKVVQLAIAAPVKVRSPPTKGLRPARLSVASVRQRGLEPWMGETLGVTVDAAVAIAVAVAVTVSRWTGGLGNSASSTAPSAPPGLHGAEIGIHYEVRAPRRGITVIGQQQQRGDGMFLAAFASSGKQRRRRICRGVVVFFFFFRGLTHQQLWHRFGDNNRISFVLLWRARDGGDASEAVAVSFANGVGGRRGGRYHMGADDAPGGGGHRSLSLLFL